MGRLDGRVALITGGARGQGGAEAQLFAAEGAQVVITDVLDAEGAETAKAIGGKYLHHDVSSESRWDEVIAEVLKAHGRLDVLVNNAGIFKTGGITNTSLGDYMRVIEVNQVGVFLGMRAAAKPMMEQGSGSIVNISSVAGMQGSPGAAAYGASKWAVRGMTKGAASELGRYGIRVNSIHPGMIDTQMLHEIPAIDAGGSERWTKRIPLRRFAEAEEVAKLALYLASDESSYCSGSEFVVDGAMTAS
jgi:3alpha(or 20beta)-hydroxysteroid dehydrogenase